MEGGQSATQLAYQTQELGIWPRQAGMWEVSAEECRGQINRFKCLCTVWWED